MRARRTLLAASIAALAAFVMGACSPAPSSSAEETAAPANGSLPASAPVSAAAAPANGSAPATPAASGSAPASASAVAGAKTTAGGCARPVAAKPATKVTTVSLPSKVTGYGNEGDTEKLPMALAARPDGTSWLAWLGTDGKVHLGRLGCDDKLVGTPTSFTGIDLQDVQADATGGVILLTRKGNCGSGPLCGGESSPCNTMHMIRFDNNGKQVWQRQVTNLTGSRTGYSDGARFVWWYQHHGRLATNGSDWAAYFGVAITVKNGNCVDIHQGDRIQVVNRSGNLVAGHKDAAEVGCSHAWTSRIVWDPRTKRFAAVCATDNDCRIAQPNPYRTVATGTCDGTLFGGDLILAKSKGYWTAWSQGGTVRLEKFTTGRSTTTIRTGVASKHPHLVTYGPNRMLLSWQSGAGLAAQVYDASTGKAVGARLSLSAKDHDYQAFKSYPDGSAAYPATGGTTTTIKIARVLPQS
ncbi:hypothetical protein [Actinoplanes couchii]|uniref:Uncharacterized protein n=1 Tax=Actinoplanes couchii TaxID=403638 RepID=A0ABQ3X794_9ACTN|nr:hypothetical protein [Actinoplanes couchii]MDR6322223.1 hypothetical protein [Actinoplanes couchii]GID54385.1 hypothetical protein Aco03nite_027890 [Actinoplanes couchii]